MLNTAQVLCSAFIPDLHSPKFVKTRQTAFYEAMKEKRVLDFDTLKCLNNPCETCPLRELQDPAERSDAGYAVADVLGDPVYPLLLGTASLSEVVGMGTDITERKGVQHVKGAVISTLALKAAGLCSYKIYH